MAPPLLGIIAVTYPFDNHAAMIYNLIKVRLKFLTLGVFLLSALLVSGGLYFRSRGLNFFKEDASPPGGEVSGASFEVPVYQPSTVISRSEFKEALEVTLEAAASLETVFNFYQERLLDQGFIQTFGDETLGSVYAKFSGPDDQLLELTLEADSASGKTIATLYLTN